MADKVTTLVLKVDLQCPSCYRKIRKVLCKFPQVRDQIYDEKNNTVTIRVCCSPEKIRDKLCCKGGKSIKSIEIKEPPKAKDPADKPKAAAAADKPKEHDKPKPPPQDKPKEADKAKPAAEKPKEAAAEKPKAAEKGGDKPKSGDKPAEAPKANSGKDGAPAPAPKALEVQQPLSVPGFPSAAAYTYYGPYSEGYGYPMGPYYHGYGAPVMQPPQQVQYYDSYGYGGRGTVNRYDYFSEENPSACSIM